MTDDSAHPLSGWLSPSSAARLLRCPASVTTMLTGGPPQATQIVPANAGSAAHLAVQRWIEAGDWRSDDNHRLPQHLRQVLHEFGMDPATMPNGRTTEARLRIRAPQLADSLRRLMTGESALVHAELPLYAPSIHLWGVPDIFIDSESAAIIDLKTGTAGAGADPDEDIKNQLLLYAALAHATTSRWPSTLAVFSLRTGYQDVPYEPRTAEALQVKLTTARDRWASGDRPAIPDPAGCRHCTQRLTCDPHWQAAAQWPDQSALQGTILQTRLADNGRTAIRVATATGTVWLTGLVTPIAADQVGRRVRAVFLGPAQTDDAGRTLSWRANQRTEIRIY